MLACVLVCMQLPVHMNVRMCGTRSQYWVSYSILINLSLLFFFSFSFDMVCVEAKTFVSLD